MPCIRRAPFLRYNSMRVFLLGATGLLGHNVLQLLLERGYEVVAAVRRCDGLRLPHSMLDSPRLQVVECQYAIDQLREAARHCDAIINCAGTTDMSLLRYTDYVPINVTLCEELLQVMGELDIRTFVHVSTANTIGYGSAQHPANEEAEMASPFTNSYYAQSKRTAEQMLAWNASQHPEWHIVCLNPGFMIGAYDVKPSSGQLLLAAEGRRIMAAPEGGKSFVAVRDVATATVSALTRGKSGQRYLLAGRSLTFREFYTLQSHVCGYRQRLISVPSWLLRMVGRVGDLLRFFGCRTRLSTRNVRQLMITEYYDCTAAMQELDYAPTSLEDAIREFFQWRGCQTHD